MSSVLLPLGNLDDPLAYRGVAAAEEQREAIVAYGRHAVAPRLEVARPPVAATAERDVPKLRIGRQPRVVEEGLERSRACEPRGCLMARRMFAPIASPRPASRRP